MVDEEVVGKLYDVRLIKRLASYMKPYKLLVLGAILCSITATVLHIALPYLIKTGIDEYIMKPNYQAEKRIESPSSDGELSKIDKKALLNLRHADTEGLKRIALLYLVCLIAIVGLHFGVIYLMEYLGQLVIKDIRMQTFSHLQKLKVAFFDRTPVGRLVTRVTNDGEALNKFFTEVAVTIFIDVFVLIGVVIIMLRLNVKLSLVTFLVIPPLAVVTNLFRIKVRKVYRKVRTHLARINTTLNENLTGIKIIKFFNREAENEKRFREINHKYYLANMQQVIVFGIFRPSMELLLSCGIALIIWWGGGQVLGQILSLGALVAFLAYIQMFFDPIREISEKFNILQASMAACEKIFRVLDNTEFQPEPEGKEPLERVHGKIEFNNVWFSYNEEPVLKDVSFQVNPGEKVAIVGPTGAGKTSLINLLTRFYEVKRGEIAVDGVDIRQLKSSFLRSNIAVVSQESFIFSGSVQDNIRLREERISDEFVRKIAHVVNADKFIQKLPQGYDEDVKERGSILSSGERQLLAFARALAFEPKILILDEATKEVDSKTEYLIQDAISKLLEGRTSIVIAHRLSTIKHVDRIIVLHKGRIIEEGTHEELLAKEGFYAKLYELQYK